MIINFRTPAFVAIALFAIISLFQDEESAFMAGYLMSTVVFCVTAIFTGED